MSRRAMVNRRRVDCLRPVGSVRLIGLLLVTVFAVLSATSAPAQEKKVSLIFTGELLTRIATDNLGEQSDEIVDRIIGLSPSVLTVRLQRASGRVSLFLTTSGVDEFPLSFQFTLDKMVYYRMRTAGADVTGMTEALQEAKAAEPLLREVGYRYDGRYSSIDLTLDLRQAIEAAREIQARRAAEERAVAEEKAAAEARAKAAAAARAEAAAKAAVVKPAASGPEEKPRPVPREAVPPPPAKEATH